MTNRKYLVALTDLTAYMRKAALQGERVHIQDLAKHMQEDHTVIETFLAEALKTDYRDEQLEIFCGLLVHTTWPKELQSATSKVNFTAMYPPLKILSALSGYPLDKVEEMNDTQVGRQLLEEYINKFWVPARDGWLTLLDNDFVKTKLGQRMNELYPGRPPAIEVGLTRALGEALKGQAPSTIEQAAEVLSQLFGRPIQPKDIVSM